MRLARPDASMQYQPFRPDTASDKCVLQTITSTLIGKLAALKQQPRLRFQNEQLRPGVNDLIVDLREIIERTESRRPVTLRDGDGCVVWRTVAKAGSRRNNVSVCQRSASPWDPPTNRLPGHSGRCCRRRITNPADLDRCGCRTNTPIRLLAVCRRDR